MAIKTNNICVLTDKKGKNNIECEINKNGEIQDYVELRIKDKNGEWIKSYISIQELYGMIFMLVGEKEQTEMMPVRKTEVRIYERQHRIKLKKDMKKGEIVIANCRIEVPLLVEEGLYGLVKRKARQSTSILIPRKI